MAVELNTTKTRRKRKPFTVWPSDRERPIEFDDYRQAERYAKVAIKRLEGSENIHVEKAGVRLATVAIDYRDRIVVDMTQEGAAYA